MGKVKEGHGMIFPDEKHEEWGAHVPLLVTRTSGAPDARAGSKEAGPRLSTRLTFLVSDGRAVLVSAALITVIN